MLTISQVAAATGMKASAIRYYEQLGVLPRPRRVGGQRRYDSDAIADLAVLTCAQQAGFTLEEIRRLFFGFAPTTAVSQRWRTLAAQKRLELQERIRQLRHMQDLLRDLQARCTCETVRECGRKMLERRRSPVFDGI